jgi:hypothetical protein
MHLLQSGVDMAVIALWLGHEDLDTTHIYMEADLALKEKAQQPPASRAKCASLQSLRQSAGVPGHSIIMYYRCRPDWVWNKPIWVAFRIIRC